MCVPEFVPESLDTFKNHKRSEQIEIERDTECSFEDRSSMEIC